MTAGKNSAADPADALGFAWRVRKNGEVQVLHHGRLAATLRGAAAQDFLLEAEQADAAALQQSMARLTGNYKRGNERAAAAHPRNRRAGAEP
jgi:hypothetical protein